MPKRDLKMNRIRFINEKSSRTGAQNMAHDLSVLHAVAAKQSNSTLRIYTWTPPSVTIGYFQKLEVETNEKYCAAHGIDIIRRITGGGAVFHEHEITYSLIISLSDEKIPEAILDSYTKILFPVIRALQSLGINASHSPINDIVVEGKKISGSAQTRRRGVLLQHGTILLSMDKDKAFSCLKVPQKKIADKGIIDPSSRITTLSDMLGNIVFDNEFIASFRNNIAQEFCHSLSAELIEGNFSNDERACAKEMEEKLFGTEEWNKNRRTEFPY
jgi:lipoate-protein ligase A